MEEEGGGQQGDIGGGGEKEEEGGGGESEAGQVEIEIEIEIEEEEEEGEGEREGGEGGVVWIQKLWTYLAWSTLVVLVLFVVAIVVVLAVGAKESLTQAFLSFADSAEESGWCGVAIMVVIVFLLTIIPVCIFSLVSIGAGFIWGTWWGFVILYTGTMLGSLVCFFGIRACLREWIRARASQLPHFPPFERAVGHEGFVFLLALRLSPITQAPVTIAASVTSLPALPYILATALGSTKFVLHTWVGAHLRDLSNTEEEVFHRYWYFVVLAVLAGIATMGYCWYFVRKAMDKYSHTEGKEEEEEETKSTRRLILSQGLTGCSLT
eukprot:Nk52_evm1s2324 gene=Nk52_evmTU1s2324